MRSKILVLLLFLIYLSALSQSITTAPIHIASCEGTTNVLHFILDELKQNLIFSDLTNANDKEGKTPLHYCCEQDDDIFATLL